jgi:large subunit ribosomal protein L5e
MAFVKIQKNKAYHKRYQTKWRRRREGKTDYQARRRLIVQEKDKYDSKKYRFVVRRTNRRIICQVIYATIQGDKTLVSADSNELKRFGVNAGLTNYAASYCTGLLTARRLLSLKEIGMSEMYKGQTKPDGSLYSVQDHLGDRRPFKAFLDVGIRRTTTGNRVFGAMKGACDGGLYIPHNEKRFPGYHIQKAEAVTNKKGKKLETQEKAKASFEPKEHRAHIFGEHVQAYFDKLKKDSPNDFKRQFSKWSEALSKSGSAKIADIYAKAHEAIRKNPASAAKKPKAYKPTVVQQAPTLIMKDKKGKKWLRQKKIGLKMRKERVQARMQKLLME